MSTSNVDEEEHGTHRLATAAELMMCLQGALESLLNVIHTPELRAQLLQEFRRFDVSTVTASQDNASDVVKFWSPILTTSILAGPSDGAKLMAMRDMPDFKLHEARHEGMTVQEKKTSDAVLVQCGFSEVQLKEMEPFRETYFQYRIQFVPASDIYALLKPSIKAAWPSSFELQFRWGSHHTRDLDILGRRLPLRFSSSYVQHCDSVHSCVSVWSKFAQKAGPRLLLAVPVRTHAPPYPRNTRL